MQVLIVGGGRVGSELAKRMSDEYQDVILIEKRDEVIDELENTLDVMLVKGSGTSTKVLERAGIAQSSIFIAATEVDEVNILACMMAKAFGVPRTVARIRDPEFQEGRPILSPSEFGIDIVINPERVTALEIARKVRSPKIIDFEYFGDKKIAMVSFHIESNSPVIGIKLRDLPMPGSSRIMAITRKDDQLLIPRGDDVICEGDKVYMVGKREYLYELDRMIRSEPNNKRRNIVILGGGMVGQAVAEILESHKPNNIHVKIIEKDFRICEEIANHLKKTLVIHGDATDSEVLREEMEQMDISVAVTGDDEVNLMASLLAKTYGVEMAISQVIKPHYELIFDRTGIDFTINKHMSTVSQIIRLIRKADVISLMSLENNRAEIAEIVVSENAKIAGLALYEAALPKGMMVATVMREGDVFIATGPTRIEPGDRVVLFSQKGMDAEIKRIFG